MSCGQIKNILYYVTKDAENNTVWAFSYKNQDASIVAFANKLVEMKKMIESTTDYKCALGFNCCGIFVKTDYPNVLHNVELILGFVDKLKKRFISESLKEIDGKQNKE